MRQVLFCAFKVMGAIVSAFDFFVAGYRIKFETFRNAFFDDFECGLFVSVKKQKIKARATSHWAEIYNLVLILTVSHYGCKKVLYGVHGGDVKIIAFIGLFEAQIVGENVFVYTA